MTIAVLDGTFKLIEKTTHLKCDLRDTQYWTPLPMMTR